MKTDFEVEMSEAFVARAAAVPADAATRLRSIDYRPREHRLRAPAAGAGVLAGAATAGTVLAVVLGSSAPAYAGWSATPASGTTAPSPSADASCQSQLAAVPAGPGGGATAGGTWDTVLTDVRGPFTVAMFQNNGAYAVCFTGTSFTEINEGSVASASSTGQSSARSSVSVHGEAAGAGGTSTQSVSISNTASGSLQQVLQNHLTTASDGPYTLIDGRTQPGVTGVTLVRDDGQDVVATVADGWFVAWWPGSSGATSAQVTTASGTTTEPLVALVMPNPPQPSPGGSGSTSSGSSSKVSGNSGNSGNSGAGGTSSTGPNTSSSP